MRADDRDYITIADEKGRRKDYSVEALFDMEDESYALLKAQDETIVMKVEGEEEGNQYLLGISDPAESEAILDAYQIAVESVDDQ